MGEAWSVDLSHFDYPDERMPRPAWRLASYFASIVAATLSRAYLAGPTEVRCRRRPGHARCSGIIHSDLHADRNELRWWCPACDDQGLISNWRGTRWDPEARRPTGPGTVSRARRPAERTHTESPADPGTDREAPRTLTTGHVKRHADPTSWERGRSYVDRVCDARLVGDTLAGSCIGSRGEAYEMEMRLGLRGIEEFGCTCPRGDFCKHLVALALTWIRRPDSVFVVDENRLRARLAQRSKDELAEIIIDIARRDILVARSLVQDATSGDGPGAGSTPFADLVRECRTVAERCHRPDYSNPYQAAYGRAAEVRKLMRDAGRLAGSSARARLAFYTAVYSSLEDHIGEVDDSDGEFGDLAWSCTEEMARAGAQQDLDGSTRAEWLALALPLYIDNEYGLGDNLRSAILSMARSEHVEQIARLVAQALGEPSAAARASESGDEDLRDYRREAACTLLAEIYLREGRPDEAARLYQRWGLRFHYAMHLLAAGDVAGAVEEAAVHLRAGYEVHRFSEALLEAGERQRAGELLARILPSLKPTEPYREEIATTLALLLEQKGDSAGALRLRYQLFSEEPSVDAFRSVCETARSLDLEADYAARMIAALSGDPDHCTTLIEIHLSRGDVDSAIEAYRAPGQFVDEELVLRLALAAQARRPEVSREIYERIIETLIARMGRANYRAAATLVVSLQEVTAPAEFAAWLANLKARYSNRPALKSELDRALG